jgi:hypothetical protein
MKAVEVLQKMFEARDSIHFAHLNTTKYAEHKALGKFYDGWLDLVDSFVETYQGRYARINGAITIEAVSGLDAEKYITSLRSFLLEDAMSIFNPATDIDLANIIADMISLVNHTLYMLSLK